MGSLKNKDFERVSTFLETNDEEDYSDKLEFEKGNEPSNSSSEDEQLQDGADED